MECPHYKHMKIKSICSIGTTQQVNFNEDLVKATILKLNKLRKEKLERILQ